MIAFHINIIILSLILLAKSMVCQPISDSEHKPNDRDLNESDLRYLIARSLSRHPLGILGHIIVEAVGDQANVGDTKGPMSVRDRRYLTSNSINDQSFLRFGRNPKRNNKRPQDFNDTSFLRFGRSQTSDN